jgi:hypothetical protein
VKVKAVFDKSLYSPTPGKIRGGHVKINKPEVGAGHVKISEY